MKPEMKAFGFIVDANLYRLGKMIIDNKGSCKIMSMNLDSKAIQEIALREKLIFLTKKKGVFLRFPSQLKCQVKAKSPECKFSHS